MLRAVMYYSAVTAVCVVTCLKYFPLVSCITLWDRIICEKQFLVFHGGRSFIFIFTFQPLFPI